MNSYFRENHFPTVGQLVEELKKLDPETPLVEWTGGCCDDPTCGANYLELGFLFYKDKGGRPVACTASEAFSVLGPLVRECEWESQPKRKSW